MFAHDTKGELHTRTYTYVWKRLIHHRLVVNAAHEHLSTGLVKVPLFMNRNALLCEMCRVVTDQNKCNRNRTL